MANGYGMATDGNTTYTGTFVNDKREGIIVRSDTNGYLQIAEFKDDFVFGKMTIYDGAITNFLCGKDGVDSFSMKIVSMCP